MKATTLILISTILVALLVSTAADLKSDLSEFKELIPRRRIGYIAAQHYILDGSFRNALTYVRSAEFLSVWQQIRDTPEFTKLAKYVNDQGTDYDVSQLAEKLPNNLRSFQIPAIVPVQMMFQRRLSSFLHDAVNALPRYRIAKLVTRKVEEGGDFAKLYRAMNSEEFHEMVEKAKRAKSLEAPLGELKQNNIDVDNIIDIGFSVLKWGP